MHCCRCIALQAWWLCSTGMIASHQDNGKWTCEPLIAAGMLTLGSASMALMKAVGLGIAGVPSVLWLPPGDIDSACAGRDLHVQRRAAKVAALPSRPCGRLPT